MSNLTHIPLDHIRHSAAHLLAMAVLRLYPGTKLGVGPVTPQGFYHDFQFPQPIKWDDIQKIEQEMLLIVQENLPFTQIIVPREQAYNILLMRAQMYKAELLESVPDAEVSFYKTGEEFIDLCRGPHVASTGHIGALKLMSLEETFWRGDEQRPQLQRIYGTAFRTLPELKAFLAQQQELQSRDYRQISQDLGLRLGGNKRVIYTQTGAAALDLLAQRAEEVLRREEYEKLVIPSVRNPLDYSQPVFDLFTNKNRSYRELPWRVYHHTRSELTVPIEVCSKEFYALSTIEAFSIDDDGIGELSRSLDLLIEIFKAWKLKVTAKIHTQNTENQYYRTTVDTLTRAYVSQTHFVDPLRHPSSVSIELVCTDELGREWMLGYLQRDLSTAKYVSKSGEFALGHVHRASVHLDAVLAFMLESQAGRLPFWLSPIQALVVPITDLQQRYAENLVDALEKVGFRAQLDARGETMQNRIRQAELRRIPAIIVVGEKEQNAQALSLRLGDKQEIGLVSLQEALETLGQLE